MRGLGGKSVLLIVAPVDFRDEELFDTRFVLERAGVRTVIASEGTGVVVGMLGGTVEAEIALGSVSVAGYDAIVFIGGSGSAAYFNNAVAIKIARDAVALGKVLAAICIAPSILANAGVLKGRSATAFSGEAANLESKGAIYTGQSVVVDGKIITGNGPVAARQFGQEIVNALGN